MVVIDGVRVNAARVEGVLADPCIAAPGTTGYAVFYGTAAAEIHTSTEIVETANTINPPTGTVVGYDLGVSVTLSAAEAALTGSSLHLLTHRA